MIPLPLWQHPFWQHHRDAPVLTVRSVPKEPDLSLWLDPEVFLVHSAPEWLCLAPTEWATLYQSDGALARPQAEDLLDAAWALYTNADTEEARALSCALWVGLWSHHRRLWIHPNYFERTSADTECLMTLIEKSSHIQWILCRPLGTPGIDWHQLENTSCV